MPSDLRSTPPLWRSDASAGASVVGERPPARADVVVVGGGLAGLCTALACAEDGASVVVLEASAIGSRTTGHSTAKLTALHSDIYSALVRGKGTDAAQAYAAANVEAVMSLRATIERLDIDCALTSATAYTCAATADGVERIEQEANAAQAAGLPAELVDAGLEVPALAAVALADQAHLDLGSVGNAPCYRRTAG